MSVSLYDAAPSSAVTAAQSGSAKTTYAFVIDVDDDILVGKDFRFFVISSGDGRGRIP